MTDTQQENVFAQAKDAQELLGMLAGAASLCWDSPELAGVFRSEEASVLVDQAYIRLEEIIHA